MLALGNALILSPKLLLLDEPSLGLAPPLVSQALGRIQQISKDAGMTVVIVEQKVREVLKIARRVYVLRTGQISFAGPANALGDDAKLREVYLQRGPTLQSGDESPFPNESCAVDDSFLLFVKKRPLLPKAARVD
jgi:ABC-type branched-subunit amino acid transport system ATPase component